MWVRPGQICSSLQWLAIGQSLSLPCQGSIQSINYLSGHQFRAGLVEHSWAQVSELRSSEQDKGKDSSKICSGKVATLWSLSVYTEIQNNCPLGLWKIQCSQHRPDDWRFSYKAHSNVNVETSSQAVKGYKIYNPNCFPLSHTAHWLC